MHGARTNFADLNGEFDDVSLPDERLNRRLKRIVSTLAAAPGSSLPKVASSESELEAIYRFFQNDRVTPEVVLEPHYSRTRARIEAEGGALIIHDTTEFRFGGKSRREELGRVHESGLGFYGHFAFAVSRRDRLPLGVLGIKPFFRREKVGELTVRERLTKPYKETSRWRELVDESGAKVEGPEVIHVMDREADAYALLAHMKDYNQRFVVRMSQDRFLAPIDESGCKTVSAALRQSEDVVTRKVAVTARGRSQFPLVRKIHPQRDGRIANLHFKAVSVQVRRTRYADGKTWSGRTLPSSLQVNAVLVYEPAPPTGETPVEWLLLTSEAIDTKRQVEAVVDAYRARWTIEEYFKALKSGCRFESRQLESRHALLNALAVFSVIAARLLLLRTLSRVIPNASATTLLSLRQLKLLRCLSRRVPIDESASLSAAFLAIAGLGGHLKHNGEPGWQVLWLGFEELLKAESIARALEYDQS